MSAPEKKSLTKLVLYTVGYGQASSRSSVIPGPTNDNLDICLEELEKYL